MSEVLDATGERQARPGKVSAMPRASRLALSPETLRREAPRLAMLIVVVVVPILVLDARWLSFGVITGIWGLAALTCRTYCVQARSAEDQVAVIRDRVGVPRDAGARAERRARTTTVQDEEAAQIGPSGR